MEFMKGGAMYAHLPSLLITVALQLTPAFAIHFLFEID